MKLTPTDMEETLVTVAIQTFEKAQILKTILESEGIETYIHNVNLIQPVISAGVRVRIKESDLTKAISVIEQINECSEECIVIKPADDSMKILLPVDFSDYSMKACDLAFNLANSLDAEVMLLHTYFNPVYNNVPLLDTIPYSAKDEESLKRIIKKVSADMENLTNMLGRKIEKGELPNIKFKTALKEGIPEEEINKFSKEYNPSMIIMGTRGRDRKEQDLIGSVTAELIDRSMVPVLAIPEDADLSSFESVNNIAFATNFDPKDLIAFEKLYSLLKAFKFKVHFIHFEQSINAWNEIKLAGIKEYFKKHYPELETEYHIIKGKDILSSLDQFVNENKIDIISLSTHKRNIVFRLFNPSFARKMIFHSNTPMLIFQASTN